MIVMPKRLADDVARRVRALIEEQQLEAGMRLPAERQLAAQLGVSRNSLREALAMLVNEGVLLSRRGGGTFVRFQHEPWSEQNIVQPLKTLLADDPDCTLIEPIAAHKDSLPKVYEGELMLGGGHVAGWAVEDPALIAQIENALTVLGSQEEFDKKYPDATRRDPLTLAVGDGNHSLATAKACWEELKKTLTPEQAENHPARWCLAEVCNVHSPAIEIEPIHRVLFNVDCATVLLSLITWSDANMAGCCFGGSKKQPFTLAGPHMANVLSFEDPTEPLTVGTIDDFISDYIERHPEAKVDYVHDEPAVRALCKQGAVAFLMPPFAKSDLFRGVVMGGVLPRKTFSMGHAEEKRYYIECRKITE